MQPTAVTEVHRIPPYRDGPQAAYLLLATAITAGIGTCIDWGLPAPGNLACVIGALGPRERRLNIEGIMAV